MRPTICFSSASCQIKGGLLSSALLLHRFETTTFLNISILLTDTHRHTQTHADTHRHTQTHADTHRHTQTHTDTHRHTQTHTQTHTNAHRHTQTHTDKHRHNNTNHDSILNGTLCQAATNGLCDGGTISTNEL